MAEQLSLRWNNHVKNFKFALGQLQQRELYSDATVSCEDQFYPVHKFVLSTCSDYFASVFEKTPCKHPVIVLRDVSSKDIEFLLNYMYGGEASVSQADLPSLIRTAEALQIKGLAAPDDSPTSPAECVPSSNSEPEQFPKKSVKEQERPRKRSRSQSFSYDAKSINLDDNYMSTEEDRDEVSTHVNDKSVTQDNQSHSSTQFDQDNIVKQEVDDISSLTESFSNQGTPSLFQQDSPQLLDESKSLPWTPIFGGSVPPDTPTTEPNLTDLLLNSKSRSFHLPTQLNETSDLRLPDLNHDGSSAQKPSTIHPCPMCPKVFQSRADNVRHMRTHTGEKPYKCPYCDYRAALKGNMKSHVISKHAGL